MITRNVDVDHAGDQITRWSHTGILIFFNSVPIFWHSKCQGTIESSTFGSKFVALKTALYIVNILQYKLCVMGVHTNGSAYMFGDNMIVVNIFSIPH